MILIVHGLEQHNTCGAAERDGHLISIGLTISDWEAQGLAYQAQPAEEAAYACDHIACKVTAV